MSKNRHHYLPECFIKNFAENGKTNVIDIKKFKDIQKFRKDKPPEIIQLAPKAICYIDNFHTLEEGFRNRFPAFAHYDDMELEDNVFGRLETEFGRIMPIIKKEQRLKLSQAESLIKFLISLKLRNPFRKERINPSSFNLHTQPIRDLKEEVAKRYPRLPDDFISELTKSIIEEYSEDPKFPEQFFKGGLLRRHSPGGLLDVIYKKLIISKWYLLKACTGSHFISPDNPGFSVSDNIPFNTKYDKDFSFFFPLSSDFCFYLSDNDVEGDNFMKEQEKIIIQQEVSKVYVDKINQTGLLFKNRYIISKYQDDLRTLIPFLIKE